MALKPNAPLTFTRYTVLYNGVELWFTCADPGAGEQSEYSVFLEDAVVATLTTQQLWGQAALDALKRQVRANGIAKRLDSMIGRTITLP